MWVLRTQQDVKIAHAKKLYCPRFTSNNSGLPVIFYRTLVLLFVCLLRTWPVRNRGVLIIAPLEKMSPTVRSPLLLPNTENFIVVEETHKGCHSILICTYVQRQYCRGRSRHEAPCTGEEDAMVAAQNRPNQQRGQDLRARAGTISLRSETGSYCRCSSLLLQRRRRLGRVVVPTAFLSFFLSSLFLLCFLFGSGLLLL